MSDDIERGLDAEDRKFFSAIAMHAIISNPQHSRQATAEARLEGKNPTAKIAEWSVKQADAMMEALGAGEGS